MTNRTQPDFLTPDMAELSSRAADWFEDGREDVPRGPGSRRKSQSAWTMDCAGGARHRHRETRDPHRHAGIVGPVPAGSRPGFLVRHGWRDRELRASRTAPQSRSATHRLTGPDRRPSRAYRGVPGGITQRRLSAWSGTDNHCCQSPLSSLLKT